MPDTARSVRWLVVGGTVSPYTVDLWSQVAGLPGHSVVLASVARRDAASFEHEVFRRDSPPSFEWVRLRSRWPSVKAQRILARARPDVLVGLGYATPYALVLASAARMRGRARRVYMGDTNGLRLIEGSATLLGLLRLASKRALVKTLFQEAFVLGWSNRVAATALGLRRVTELPLLTVDFEKWLGAPTVRVPELEAAVSPRFACVARLVEEKNLFALLDAWRMHLAAGRAGSLLIVGDGPLRRMLEDQVRAMPADRVVLLGARDRETIGNVLRRCDALILPSVQEAWGLVVTEALGLGVPVLASDKVGAAVSLALTTAGAVALCGTSAIEIAAGLADFLRTGPARAEAARRCAPSVRDAFGTATTADRLAAWAESALGQRPDACSTGSAA